MSISVTIAALEAAGRLTRHVPRTRQPPRRRLYLSAAALQDLTDPQSAVCSLVGRGFIEAALTRWTSGGRIYGDSKGRFLRRLDPPPREIWEIRVTEPVVQARLFGRFAEPDTMIMMRFHTRQLLGKYGSANWSAAMSDCETGWVELFGSAAPFAGRSIRDYVTENCDDFPI